MKCDRLLSWSWVFILVLLLPWRGSGQNIRHLDIDNGLSNNNVNAIFKDRLGYLWFGTVDGLNRFDGYNFKIFRAVTNDPAAIAGNDITSISQDHFGRLWVATQSNGVSILDERNGKFQRLKRANSASLNNPFIDGQINTLTYCHDQSMLIGTNSEGLLVYDSNEKLISISLPGLRGESACNYSVQGILEDNDNHVYVLVNNHGLYEYKKGNKNLTYLTRLAELNYNCIADFGKDKLLLGTNSGLYIYDKKQRSCEKVNITSVDGSSQVKRILVTRDKRIWLAIAGKGILITDSSGRILQELKKGENGEYLNSNFVKALLEDDRDNIWIGSVGGGIDIQQPQKGGFHKITHLPYKTDGLVNSIPFSFYEQDSDHVWIGTYDAGISIWNRKSNTFKRLSLIADPSLLNHHAITRIIKDHNGDVWIATAGSGIMRYQSHDRIFKQIRMQPSGNLPVNVISLYEDADRNIWAGCLNSGQALKSGLFKFNKTAQVFEPVYQPVPPEVLSILDDGKGNLWVGCFQQLWRITKKNGRLDSIKLNGSVRSLHLDRKGTLWIGTVYKGLWSYNIEKKQLRHFSERDGLCNDAVLNIEEDRNGMLWISTFNGLSQFNPKTTKFLNFYATDGLQSNEFFYNASLKLRSGELIFGGIKGFNIFDPDSIIVDKYFAPLRLTEIRVLNKPLQPNDPSVKGIDREGNITKIELPYEKAVLSVDYAALEFNKPNNIQYAYYLQGWDKAWNFVRKQRSLTYSRLYEGHYVLLLKSTNASDTWRTSTTAVEIIILPPGIELGGPIFVMPSHFAR